MILPGNSAEACSAVADDHRSNLPQKRLDRRWLTRSRQRGKIAKVAPLTPIYLWFYSIPLDQRQYRASLRHDDMMPRPQW
jgi:hypothetical protein